MCKKFKCLLTFTIIIITLTSCVLFSILNFSMSNPLLASNSRLILSGTQRTVMIRNTFTPTIPVHTQAGLRPKRKEQLSMYNKSLHSPIRNQLARPFHESLYKPWSKGVITQSSPSLQYNCSELMAGNVTEIKQIITTLNKPNRSYTSSFENLGNCEQVLNEFKDNFYVSKEEKSFPIAFVLVVHINAHQILRFLKVIYRYHNIYCIHPDLKSGKKFLERFKLVSRCLPNVLLPSQLHKVLYNRTDTILEAQLSCLKDLETQHYRRWKYVITLCGRELPLKTNRYIVEVLRYMNNQSVINSKIIDMHTLDTRFAKVKQHMLPPKAKKVSVEFIEKNEHNNSIRLYKSMTYNALSLNFVRYILYNRTMQTLTQWMMENCTTPEEHLYATAYMMPGAPGGFRPEKTHLPIVSKSIWKHLKSSHYYAPGEKCSGNSVHQVCILNTADLPLISQEMLQKTWFFNKYFMEEDHVVMDCVEQQIIRDNKREFSNDLTR